MEYKLFSNTEKLNQMIALYLEGKWEEEIALILAIPVVEVTSMLSYDSVLSNSQYVSKVTWIQIQKQRSQRKREIRQLLKKSFNELDRVEVMHYIQLFCNSKQSTSAFCSQNQISEVMFHMHILNEQYLMNKLGKGEGSYQYYRILTYLTDQFKQQSKLYSVFDQKRVRDLSYYYLHSIYTKREFCIRYQLSASTFDSIFQNPENPVFTSIQKHQAYVTKLRNQKLPEKHVWIRDYMVRDQIKKEVVTLPMKDAIGLDILLCYLKYAGDISEIKTELKKAKTTILKTLTSIDRFEQVLLPSIYHAIKQLMYYTDNHEELLKYIWNLGASCTLASIKLGIPYDQLFQLWFSPKSFEYFHHADGTNKTLQEIQNWATEGKEQEKTNVKKLG